MEGHLRYQKYTLLRMLGMECNDMEILKYALNKQPLRNQDM